MKPQILLDTIFSMAGLPVIFNHYNFGSKDEIADELQKFNRDAQAIQNKADRENRDLTSLECRQLDAIFAEFEDLETQLNNFGKSAGRVTKPEPIRPQNSRRLPGENDFFSVRQSPALRSTRDADVYNALGTFARTGIMPNIQNAMVTTTDADGGYSVLPLTQGVNDILRNANPLRQLVDFRSCPAHDSIEEIISADVAASAWVAEAGARSATNTPTMKKITAALYEIYTNQTVSQKMIDTYSLGDLGRWLSGRIAAGIAELESSTFFQAQVASSPIGLQDLTLSTAGDATRTWGQVQKVVSGEAAALTDPEVLMTTLFSLKAGHRSNAIWVMNSTTASAVMKMKDTAGTYVWSQNFQAGQPPMLLGRPVVIAEDMDGIGAGQVPIYLANWKEAILAAEQPGFRLLQDPYSNKPNVQFYAYQRSGWALRDSNAIKAISIEV